MESNNPIELVLNSCITQITKLNINTICKDDLVFKVVLYGDEDDNYVYYLIIPKDLNNYFFNVILKEKHLLKSDGFYYYSTVSSVEHINCMLNQTTVYKLGA